MLETWLMNASDGKRACLKFLCETLGLVQEPPRQIRYQLLYCAVSTFFKPVLSNTETLLVPTICLYEVYKWIVTQRDEEEALAAIAWMATA